jgi:hypothetical protein
MQRVGRQQVNFAEAARHQEADRLGRQFLDRNLTRSGAHGIGPPAILDDGGVGETQDTRGRQQAGTDITEGIGIFISPDMRVNLDAIGS